VESALISLLRKLPRSNSGQMSSGMVAPPNMPCNRFCLRSLVPEWQSKPDAAFEAAGDRWQGQ
jgi:hypothetical protein